VPRNRPRVAHRFIVVAGQCSKVGKTALVVDVIRAFPRMNWTAVKITPYARSGCPINGSGCPCGPLDYGFAIREERDASGTSDSSRFLAAGAVRSFWVETKCNGLPVALASLKAVLKGSGSLIVESNAVVEFWRPDILLLVIDPQIPDLKPSARRLIPFIDVFVLRSPLSHQHPSGFPAPAWANARKLLQRIGDPLPAILRQLVGQPLRRFSHPN
jgi:hypothetical protein